jgi:hypothetical protein
MDQDDSWRAKQEELEELRKKLNDEIEKRDFNLCAPSVMKISVELDHCIVEHYQKQ